MENNSQKTPCKPMPIIRIAPLCNGKIYVIPQEDTHRMDLPLMEEINGQSGKSFHKQAKVLTKRHEAFINTSEHPRFSVKYLSPVNQEEVHLYVLPLSHEDDIRFEDGQFVPADEIEENECLYSAYLQKESSLLGMAAELWDEYK